MGMLEGLTVDVGPYIARTERKSSETMFAFALQDLQSLRIITSLVCFAKGTCMRRRHPFLWRFRRRQRRTVPWTPRGHQKPQVRDKGCAQDLQGTSVVPPQWLSVAQSAHSGFSGKL